MDNVNYFRLPSTLWLVLIPAGLSLVIFSYLAPEVVPFSYLGPLGLVASYLTYELPSLLAFVFYGSMIIHVCEAAYAVHFCRKMNIADIKKWFISVLLYGGLSLHLLLRYKKKPS